MSLLAHTAEVAMPKQLSLFKSERQEVARLWPGLPDGCRREAVRIFATLAVRAARASAREERVDERERQSVARADL